MSQDNHPRLSGNNDFRFVPRDSQTFASEDHRHTWLVSQVLAADQPCVIGGPKKSLKTSVMLDLAISLGSATAFLGKFCVPEQVRVAVLSGESGTATLQETARRICESRRIELSACNVLWQTDLPCLSSPEDRDELQRGLAAAEVKVVVIDPLFLCLLGGQSKVSASNLYEIGPVLFQASKACLDAGATPVLLHHATKAAGRKADASEPLELDDLAFSGVGEFARQWLLVNRREPYQLGSGQHALTMAVGGSAGHSGVWQVDVEEGRAGTERRWEVRVGSMGPSSVEHYPQSPKTQKLTRGKSTGPVGW
jgi:replicative DNA helicase